MMMAAAVPARRRGVLAFNMCLVSPRHWHSSTPVGTSVENPVGYASKGFSLWTNISGSIFHNTLFF